MCAKVNLNLIGNWTGICYFENIRPFLPENTMKLTIEEQDGENRVTGIVTEVCERTGVASRKNVQENVFHIRGIFNENSRVLRMAGVCERQDRHMRECVLELKMAGDDKLTGTFTNPENSADTQNVILDRGDVRRDLEKLMEMGRIFLEELKRREKTVPVDPGSTRGKGSEVSGEYAGRSNNQ